MARVARTRAPESAAGLSRVGSSSPRDPSTRERLARAALCIRASTEATVSQPFGAALLARTPDRCRQVARSAAEWSTTLHCCLVRVRLSRSPRCRGAREARSTCWSSPVDIARFSVREAASATEVEEAPMPPDSSLHKARTCERLARAACCARAAMATAASVIAGLLLTLGIASALRRSQLGERVPASAWRARPGVRAERVPVPSSRRLAEIWGKEVTKSFMLRRARRMTPAR